MEHGEVTRILNALVIQPSIYDEIRESQLEDEKLKAIKKKIDEGQVLDFTIGDEGSICFKGRWCVPQSRGDLKQILMEEAHNSPYSMNLGGDKLYKDMKKTFWWPNMKREVAEFVAKCLTCQKVNIEHRRPQGKVQSLEVPKWS
ncbi:uncharacterized protein LOC110685140 [Chenopodium quinoa]|uniref:uncharacterized protein LOC110685140 n=1 Tax=Chenopodium quinoa TaxID=63459 RepID=UPI000B779A0C|nr:uncharacterized protein LOC110685140 [Chenopodium quinoa]